MRASKDSFNGLMYQSMQSMRESALPRPSVNEELPTPPLMTEERDQSTILPEPVNAESNPNMPVLNPKTNFRYSAEDSSLNGIAEMASAATDAINPVQAMSIEETLAAINNSTIMNQFTSQGADFAQLPAPNSVGAAAEMKEQPTVTILDSHAPADAPLPQPERHSPKLSSTRNAKLLLASPQSQRPPPLQQSQ